LGHQPIENARDYYYDIEGKVPIKRLNNYVLWNKKDTRSQRNGNASFLRQMDEMQQPWTLNAGLTSGVQRQTFVGNSFIKW